MPFQALRMRFFVRKQQKKNKFMRNCGLLVFRLDAVSIFSMHSQTIRNSITPSQFAECTFSNFEINAYMSFEYTWHLYTYVAFFLQSERGTSHVFLDPPVNSAYIRNICLNCSHFIFPLIFLHLVSRH